MIVKCCECHHEWQQASDAPQECRWCESPASKVLTDDYMDIPGLLDKMVSEAKERKK